MRRFASALATAVAIVSNAAPAALAAGTSPVELVPVPWTHADTGAPPLPAETPQYAIRIQVYQQCQNMNLCPGVTENPTTITLDSGATVFDQTIGAFRFRGRVMSSITGNVWTLGIRNLRLTLPALPEVGATLPTGGLIYYNVNVNIYSFAGFTVPFDGKNATTAVVTKQSGHPIYPETSWSGRLQSTGNGGPGDALTSSLLAGDEITVYGATLLSNFSASVTTEQDPLGFPGVQRVKSKTESRDPTCLSGPEPVAGYDCTNSLEIFTPRVIPSTLATTCASDLTGDGVVNFADLAKMKSVFFKTCTP